MLLSLVMMGHQSITQTGKKAQKIGWHLLVPTKIVHAVLLPLLPIGLI